MKQKKIIRLVSAALALATLFTLFAFTASASAWRTGNFNSTQYVYYNNSGKTATVKIHTYNCLRGTNHSGSCKCSTETSGKLKIAIRKTNGALISTKYVTAPATITLPKGYSSVKIDIICRQDLGASANFINTGKCTHWAMEMKTNCH